MAISLSTVYERMLKVVSLSGSGNVSHFQRSLFLFHKKQQSFMLSGLTMGKCSVLSTGLVLEEYSNLEFRLVTFISTPITLDQEIWFMWETTIFMRSPQLRARCSFDSRALLFSRNRISRRQTIIEGPTELNGVEETNAIEDEELKMANLDKALKERNRRMGTRRMSAFGPPSGTAFLVATDRNTLYTISDQGIKDEIFTVTFFETV